MNDMAINRNATAHGNSIKVRLVSGTRKYRWWCSECAKGGGTFGGLHSGYPGLSGALAAVRLHCAISHAGEYTHWLRSLAGRALVRRAAVAGAFSHTCPGCGVRTPVTADGWFVQHLRVVEAGTVEWCTSGSGGASA